MATYNLIAKSTVGAGGAASITFSSIPQTYTDLKVLVSGRTSVAGNTDSITLSINGSNANMSGAYFFYNANAGGTVNAGTAISTQELGWINGNTSTTSTFSNTEAYFINYTSSSQKTFWVDSTQLKNATGTNSFYTGMFGITWNPGTQAPITSLTFAPSAAFVQYSCIHLYGIKNS